MMSPWLMTSVLLTTLHDYMDKMHHILSVLSCLLSWKDVQTWNTQALYLKGDGWLRISPYAVPHQPNDLLN